MTIALHDTAHAGRAGTIAARLLVERGLCASEAEDAVRMVLPGAFASDAQLDHVHGRGPCVTAVADTDARAVRDRCSGAMLGLAISEMLGKAVEARNANGIASLDEKTAASLLESGCVPGGHTARALELADWLVARDRSEGAERDSKATRTLDESATAEVAPVLQLAERMAAIEQRHSRTPMTSRSGILGSLAPLALRYHADREELGRVAAEAARNLEPNGAGEAASGWLVGMLAAAIAGERAAYVVAAGVTAEVALARWRTWTRRNVPVDPDPEELVAIACWCLARSGSFAETLFLAAGLPGPSAAIAAVAGQLAGAVYGSRAIPREWMARIAGQGLLIGAARRLHAARRDDPRTDHGTAPWSEPECQRRKVGSATAEQPHAQ